MTALATACLTMGSAVAQDTPVKGAGPDQDQANNERYWGIATTRTTPTRPGPGSLSDPAFDRYAVRHGRRTGSTPPPAAPPKPAPTATSTDTAAAPAAVTTATTAAVTPAGDAH